MNNFEELNLDKKIADNLTTKGYGQPTPIQEESIPHILSGKDVLGIAQTGTGKTAAFCLPIISNLIKSNKSCGKKGVRALILTPTRELASQIADNVKSYSNGIDLRQLAIYGGVNIHNQIKSLDRGVDILIATPGRLIDLMNRGAVDLCGVEVLTLDEADRMLDMGFIDDIKKISAKAPKERQTILFSATMPKNISNLAESLLNDPVRVEVAKESTTVEKVDQKVYFVDKTNKSELLKHVLQNKEMEHVLIFSKTKYGADRIAKKLEGESIKASAIHGNKTQSTREKTLKRFRQGQIKVLVATDIAARGIDVSTITHVINYDLPQDPESYIHRIGRTARAGKKGCALAFCDKSEYGALKAIEKIINLTIEVDKDHPFHDDSSRAKRSTEGSAKSKPRRISGGNPRNSSRSGSTGGYKSRDSSNSRWDNNSSRPQGGYSSRSGSGDSRPQGGYSSRSGSGDSRGGNYERSDSRGSGSSSSNSRWDNNSSRPQGGYSSRSGSSDSRPQGGYSSRSGSTGGYKSREGSGDSRGGNYERSDSRGSGSSSGNSRWDNNSSRSGSTGGYKNREGSSDSRPQGGYSSRSGSGDSRGGNYERSDSRGSGSSSGNSRWDNNSSRSGSTGGYKNREGSSDSRPQGGYSSRSGSGDSRGGNYERSDSRGSGSSSGNSRWDNNSSRPQGGYSSRSGSTGGYKNREGSSDSRPKRSHQGKKTWQDK